MSGQNKRPRFQREDPTKRWTATVTLRASVQERRYRPKAMPDYVVIKTMIFNRGHRGWPDTSHSRIVGANSPRAGRGRVVVTTWSLAVRPRK